ncbi:MAG: universal stress protein [Xanthomonadales bacterium]|nr:universal stress protein [Xanthomonadales bacterium]MDZ4117332.1 universal stress protein [Xanthomonadaceae bacterium]MDZ4377663.1 universal stress protein [Xanthomonadaceae bacterium]
MNTPIKANNLKVILAATDFSAAADNALQRAVQLAKAHNARLELVHTFDSAPVMPAWGDPGGGAWIGEKMFMDGVRDQLERVRNQLANEHHIEINANLEVGPAHRQIAQHAAASDADLVVIGASGSSGLVQRLLGSTAQNVVRSSHVPVLVVRLPGDKAYANAVAATDFSDDAMRAAQMALQLAPGSNLHLVHAYESIYDNALARESMEHEELERMQIKDRDHAAEQLEAMRRQLAAADAQARLHSTLRDGNPDQQLDAYVGEVNAELLALGAHGKTRWEAGLLGSTTQHAVSHAPCDVLVWRRPAAD